MREQQHVADRGRIGEQHHQTVDADALAGGRRHAVLQRADVVLVELHGLLVPGFFLRHLFAKAFGLILGVVQLGKTIGDFASADKKLEVDEWGKTLSGYAPIRDQLGKPVAVVGVDIDAGDIYTLEREVARRAVFVLVAGIIAALGVAIFISQRVSGPVNQLMAGTRYIAQGNLHYEVRVSGDDEISQLAR